MEQFTTKNLIWMRLAIQDFKDPPEEYKHVLGKLDDIIITTVINLKTHTLDLK
jgi:hypothetical protein